MDEPIEPRPTARDWQDAAEAGGVNVNEVPHGAAVASMRAREAEEEALQLPPVVLGERLVPVSQLVKRLRARATTEQISSDRAAADGSFWRRDRHAGAADALLDEAARLERGE